jgi:polygalacturonase
MKIFDITSFGAIADGRTLNTRSIQEAANACRQAGGGMLRVPAGTFLTGIFELFSGTTLLVEKDGRLLASPRLDDHNVEGASVGLLYARDAHDLILTGEGTLDGNAPAFFDEGRLNGGEEDFSGCDTWQKRHGLPYGTRELKHGPLGAKGRPGNMLVLARCANVRIEKLTLTGSSYWTLHCADCEDVAIEHLRIDHDRRHANNDGIHLTTCRRVGIRHCRISSGDDAIAVTGFREPGGEAQIAFGLTGRAGVCEDIEISDCSLSSRSAAVRIGYGHNPVRHVRLNRLEIRESNRGIGIFARQAGVEDVVVENCRIETSLFHGNWWGRAEPIHLSAVRFPGEPGLFSIRKIVFRDIDAMGENAVVLFAEEPGAIEEVELVRVKMTLRRGDLFGAWGGNLDLRPGHPQLLAGGTAPLWAIGVSRLDCEDCQWKLEEKATDDFSAQPVIRERP